MEGRKGAKAFFGKNYSRSNTGTNTTTSKTNCSNKPVNTRTIIWPSIYSQNAQRLCVKNHGPYFLLRCCFDRDRDRGVRRADAAACQHAAHRPRLEPLAARVPGALRRRVRPRHPSSRTTRAASARWAWTTSAARAATARGRRRRSGTRWRIRWG